MKFQVVTRVPDPDEDGIGNMAMATDVYLELEQPGPDNNYRGKSQRIGEALGQPMLMLALRRPVFHLGEVLIVDDGGRELTGHGRKADKWDVSTETFDTAEEAVARSHEIDEREPDDDEIEDAPVVDA